MQLITITNVNTNEYFFTTNHCQQNRSLIPLGNEWVPCTYYLPYHIKPRINFENGIINSKEDLIKFNDSYNYKLIDNPDPIFAC